MSAFSKPSGRRLLKRLFVCIAHSVLMILLGWWWQTTQFTTDIEKGLVEKSVLLKMALGDLPADTSGNFIFIDVSGCKKMIPRQDRSGTEAITDRSKLAAFFNILARVSQQNYQYIICDILFDKSSPDDRLLQDAFVKTTKIITPYSFEKTGIISSVFSGTKTAYVGYGVSSGFYASGILLKYPLINYPEIKGLPVQVYESVNNKRIEKALGLAWIDGKPAVNNMLLNYRIRPQQLTDENGNHKIIDFDDLLTLLETKDSAGKRMDSLIFQQFLANKIIVIGDFENDMHDTVLGKMPGPLIFANIYLSLLHGDAYIETGLLLYLFIAFAVLSWLLFYPPLWLEHFQKLCRDTPVGFFVGELFFYGLTIWLIAFVYFLFSDFHLNVSMQSFYFVVVSSIITYYKNYKEKKELKSVKHSQQ